MNDTELRAVLADAREVYGVFGNAKKALGLVDGALAEAPEQLEALNLKAAILYELDRDDEARALHERVLALQPCSVEALHGLAALANDAQDYKTALKLLDTAFTCLERDPDPEFRENEDFRQRLVAELYNERAFALWYTGKRADAAKLLLTDAPAACPLEAETFEDELAWLEEHPDSPEEE